MSQKQLWEDTRPNPPLGIPDGFKLLLGVAAIAIIAFVGFSFIKEYNSRPSDIQRALADHESIMQRYKNATGQ